MLGVIEEWNANWRQTFLDCCNGAASGGSVMYDRDALYGSSQLKSATVLPFNRSIPVNTVSITNRDE